MSLQISEISVTYRTTREVTEDTQTITICRRGDRIDVESILPEFDTGVEASPTAGGTPYIKDPGNLTGTFEITTSARHASYTESCAAWASVLATASAISKSGWLEITAAGQTFLFPAGITGYAPALQEYFTTHTRWSFVIGTPSVNRR